MINRFFVIIVSIFIGSCSGTKQCKKNKNYFKIVDTSQRYLVESTYCISSIDDISSEESLVIVNIFDRASGEKVDEGTIFPKGDMSYSFIKGKVEINLSEGLYNIGVVTTGNHLPFSIKDLKVRSGKMIVVNCYLGSSIE